MYNPDHLITKSVLSCIFLMLVITKSHAEDTALLIGIGKYFDSAHNLPGIDIDIDTMQSFSRQLGYKKIITLRDLNATRSSILNTLGQIKTSLGPSDRFLFYYSGHGTRLPDMDGDERDALDEALAAADVHAAKINNIDTLEGVIIDDELSRILKTFNTRHTLSIIDACHSASMAKRSMRTIPIGKPGYVKKFIVLPKIPTTRRRYPSPAYGDVTAPYISISAAGDEEYAIATESGSVFTRAIKRALLDFSNQQGAFAKKNFTPYNLTSFAGEFIYQLVNPYEKYTPEISGNPLLFHQSLSRNVNHQPGKPTNKSKLNDLTWNNQLKLRSPTKQYQNGETLQLRMTTPYAGEGYLNILQVDNQDKVTILFPNQYQQNNALRFNEGAINLNNLFKIAPVEISGSASGSISVYTIITSVPLNLYHPKPMPYIKSTGTRGSLLTGQLSILVN